MTIDIRPEIEKIRTAQVAAGLYPSLEDAVSAAVFGVATDADIANGRTFGADETWAEIDMSDTTRV